MRKNTYALAPVALSMALVGCTPSSPEQVQTPESRIILEDSGNTEAISKTCAISIDTTTDKAGKVVVETASGQMIFADNGTSCSTGDVVTSLDTAEIAAFNKAVKRSRKSWHKLADQAIARAAGPAKNTEKTSSRAELRGGWFTSIVSFVDVADKGLENPANYIATWPDEVCKLESSQTTVRPLGEVNNPQSNDTLSLFQVMDSSSASPLCRPGEVIITNSEGESYEHKVPREQVVVKPR